jgi:hypothetical protein
MKATILALIGAITSVATAQDPYYNISSAPFHLVVKSSTNKTLNGCTLFACHEGAAIEGLCLGNKKLSTADVFNFNTSVYSPPDDSDIGVTGILSWLLPTAGQSYPSALTRIIPNSNSNVGVPLFYPGDSDAQQLAFDKKGLLNIQGYLDDSVFPFNVTAPKAYYRWYICVTQVGYQYTTLAWVRRMLRLHSSLADQQANHVNRLSAMLSHRTRLARRSMSSVSGRTRRDPARRTIWKRTIWKRIIMSPRHDVCAAKRPCD